MTTPRDDQAGIALFVVGCGRSGSTLLRAMLDSHPAMAIPPENYFIVPLLSFRSDFEGETGIRVRAVADYLEGNPSFQEWGLDASALFARWDTDPPGSVVTAIRELYQYYAREQGKSVVGDKSPHHVRHLPLLAQEFPEAVFVHLIRDGRAVARSLQRVHFGPRTYLGGVETWRFNVEHGRRGGAALGSRYVEIHYEALVQDPEAALTRIAALVGLDFDPAMVRYHERAGEVLDGIRRTDHLVNIAKPLDTARNTEVSPHDQRLFAAAAGDVARELGYDVPARAGIADRAQVRAYRLWNRVQFAGRWIRRRVGIVLGRRPILKAARST